MLDCVGAGRNLVKFLLSVDPSRVHETSSGDANLLVPSEFEDFMLHGTHEAILEPPSYGVSYDFTERALRVFGMSDSDIDEHVVRNKADLVRLVANCARGNPGTLVIFGSAPYIHRAQDGTYGVGTSCILVDCLAPPRNEDVAQQARIMARAKAMILLAIMAERPRHTEMLLHMAMAMPRWKMCIPTHYRTF